MPEIPSRFFEHNAELQCRRGEADRGEISDWRNVGLHGTEPLPLMLAWSQKRTAVAGVISLFMMHRFLVQPTLHIKDTEPTHDPTRHLQLRAASAYN